MLLQILPLGSNIENNCYSRYNYYDIRSIYNIAYFSTSKQHNSRAIFPTLLYMPTLGGIGKLYSLLIMYLYSSRTGRLRCRLVEPTLYPPQLASLVLASLVLAARVRQSAETDPYLYLLGSILLVSSSASSFFVLFYFDFHHSQVNKHFTRLLPTFDRFKYRISIFHLYGFPSFVSKLLFVIILKYMLLQILPLGSNIENNCYSRYNYYDIRSIYNIAYFSTSKQHNSRAIFPTLLYMPTLGGIGKLYSLLIMYLYSSRTGRLRCRLVEPTLYPPQLASLVLAARVRQSAEADPYLYLLGSILLVFRAQLALSLFSSISTFTNLKSTSISHACCRLSIGFKYRISIFHLFVVFPSFRLQALLLYILKYMLLQILPLGSNIILAIIIVKLV